MPTLAAIVGTAKALALWLNGKASVSMALALPVMRAAPTPCTPRRITSWVRLSENPANPPPTVAISAPMKKILLCPYRSPSLAARSTVLPSVSNSATTTHEAAARLVLK